MERASTESNLSSLSSLLPDDLILNYATVERLAQLPLVHIHTEYPNCVAPSLRPSAVHPTFYGCYDWHSSVHGHWLLARAAHLFPGSALAGTVAEQFRQQFTAEKIARELENFKADPTFERPYGWSWFLKLQTELESSEVQEFIQYAAILRPLATHIAGLYLDYLPRLKKPDRKGCHSNTAFGLVFALDYARTVGNTRLEEEIRAFSLRFYRPSRDYPWRLEPGRTDFLSPCLQEVDLMARVLDRSALSDWLRAFLPALFDGTFAPAPAAVPDRTDGFLVHLDGLNFSRAWTLYALAARLEELKERLVAIADEHVKASMDYVLDSHYCGAHWLATFLFLALENKRLTT